LQSAKSELSRLPSWSVDGERTIPIRKFLADGFFEPEVIKSMGTAFAGALASLGLTNKSDDLTVLVAKKIIELAKAGEHDPERLKAAVLRTFRN
jgi:hypothetical protein